jgi:hypothetical protein
MVVIPQFILKRMYQAGSLRMLPEGLAFDIVNSLGPGILTQINKICIGPLEFMADQIQLRLQTVGKEAEAQWLQACDITAENPAVFFMHQTATCIIKLDKDIQHLLERLEDNKAHTITLDLCSKEVGKVVISVQDKLALC